MRALQFIAASGCTQGPVEFAMRVLFFITVPLAALAVSAEILRRWKGPRGGELFEEQVALAVFVPAPVGALFALQGYLSIPGCP